MLCNVGIDPFPRNENHKMDSIHHSALHFWPQMIWKFLSARLGMRGLNWKCHWAQDGCMNVEVKAAVNVELWYQSLVFISFHFSSRHVNHIRNILGCWQVWTGYVDMIALVLYYSLLQSVEAGGPATISLQQWSIRAAGDGDVVRYGSDNNGTFWGEKKKQGGGQQKVIEKLATLGSPKTDSLIVWLSICNPAQPFGQKPVLLLWIFSSHPRILPFSIASTVEHSSIKSSYYGINNENYIYVIYNYTSTSIWFFLWSEVPCKEGVGQYPHCIPSHPPHG